MPVPAVNVLVAARGHSLAHPEHLGLSCIQRVDTTIAYYDKHEDEFNRGREAGKNPSIVMSGSHATMATGYRIPAPEAGKREGSLMLDRAARGGIPLEYLHKSITGTTTLEVVLRPLEEGYFRDVSANNPLGIVTQKTQWERLSWFAVRVYDLSPDCLQLIAAPGEDDPQIQADEGKLMRMTRIVYGPARTPQALRRAEAIATTGARVLTALHLQEPPALRYLQE
jgi:hypothetical protein